MSLALRNARAFAAGQAAWDNATPPEDDGRDDYITEQAGLLLDAKDADLVPFFTKHRAIIPREGFDQAGTEALLDADDSDYQLLQLVLAARRGDHELAHKLAQHFDVALCEAAEKLINKALEAA